MKATILLISIFVFTSCVAYAQQYEDVVYLKSGSIIHGTIIEQKPNESIKIKTKDGNVFVYKMEEIEKMTKEEIKGEEKQKETTPLQKLSVVNYSGFGIRGHGGTDITLGLGFGLGVYYNLTGSAYSNTSWEFGLDAYYHTSTNKYTGGPKYWESSVKEDVDLFIFALKANDLFKYRPLKSGVYFITGVGFVVADIRVHQIETPPPSSIYGTTEYYLYKETSFGNIVNLGIGYCFARHMEARIETPLLFFYSTPGGIGKIAPTFTLSIQYRF